MKAIETINLSKYYGKSRGIENVNLSVEQGEIYGFIGPNGSGKSTTIRTLLNFIYPTSGSASVMGLDVVNDSKKIKQMVGYVPAEINYYSDMKVKELFQYSAEFYKGSFAGRINELVNIFEVDEDKNISDLSYGNRKKVAIIQALIHKPEILILDEPTSGLDPLMQNNFFKLLKEENNNGTTIFFSSHILTEVQKICDRVAIIKEGEIVEIEEIEKLKKNNYKKVTLELNESINSIPFEIEGLTDLSISDNIVKFLFRGNINQLINTFTTLNLKNIWLEEPSLEEVFMHYYQKEEAKL